MNQNLKNEEDQIDAEKKDAVDKDSEDVDDDESFDSEKTKQIINGWRQEREKRPEKKAQITKELQRAIAAEHTPDFA